MVTAPDIAAASPSNRTSLSPYLRNRLWFSLLLAVEHSEPVERDKRDDGDGCCEDQNACQ